MITTLDPPDTLTSGQVEGYLQQHPDFFNEHLNLLENLHIPHPSGNAVSLISKQLELYRDRHNEMATQLSALIDIAKENDVSFSRMHELTLAMLEAGTVEEVLANLNEVLSKSFMADFTALRIIRKHIDKPIANLYVAPDDKVLAHFKKVMTSNKPECTRPTLPQARFLFGEAAMKVKSCAIVPMMFTDIEGFIAIGSREDERYHHSMGNLFLTQMSEIIGTRLISLLKQ
jgi:uncharacterized protein YigA (DUF484 family)